MIAADLAVHLPRPHAAQAAVIAGAARFNVLSCGRRWGKSTLLANRLVGPALEGFPVAWFSPTYPMLTEVWRDIRRVLLPVTARVSAQEHRLELVTGGVVDMWSLDQPDAARGRKYKRIVVDEAAMIRWLEEAWLAVIRPTLVDYRGDAWFGSTPKGFNFFKTLFDLGQDPAHEDWAAWQMPTAANPYMGADEITAARLMLPERTFSQEFLAQFLEDGGGVFRKVLQAATATSQERAIAGHQYCGGIDWGKLDDFSVFTVIDLATREVVALDRSNHVDYHVQLGRLQALQERFGCGTWIAEQNSIGVPLIEQVVRLGLPVEPFVTTNATKAQAIDALALAFEREEIKILDDPVLLAELQAYDAERLPSGLIRYGAPPGQHDDCVMSLALAWQAAASPPAAGAARDVPAQAYRNAGRERHRSRLWSGGMR